MNTPNRDEPANQPRMVIVGLDGATWSLITPWIEQGKLETLANLTELGSYGGLASTLPMFSAPAWSSFATGVNPGKHGIYDFVQPSGVGYDLHFTNASLRRAPSVWSMLNQGGISCGIVNVPMTFPPEEIAHFMISGMDAPNLESAFTHPSELRRELGQQIPDYVIVPHPGGMKLEEYVRSYQQAIDARIRALHLAFDRYPCDVLMIVFNATDALQHLCLREDTPSESCPYSEALLSIYKSCDAFLAQML